jgi:hypothetical protein
MPTSNQRSAETIADYERETSRLVAQCQRENPNDATWSPLLQTVHWFLNEHGRWAGNTIRLYANALEQEVGRMLEHDSFDPRSEEALLLRRLKTDRPSPKNQRTAEAIAAYERETSRLVAQYQRENPNEAPWSPLLQTVHWFLNRHARWAGHTIELYANALEQEVGRMPEFDTFDPRSEEALLLRRLKTDRPSPITKTKTSKKSKQVAHQKKVAAKTNKKKKPRKSIPVTELQGIPRRALGIAPANPLFVGSRSNSASTAGSVPGFTGCRAGITKRRPSYFELRTSRYGHAKCTILSEGLAEEIRRLSLDHYRRSVIDLVLRDATVDIDTRDVGAVSKRAGRDVAAAPPSRSWTKLTNALAFAVATRPPGQIAHRSTGGNSHSVRAR